MPTVLPLSRVARSLRFVLILVCCTASAQEVATPLRPLRTLLNSDGTINLSTGFSGSLDVSGWKMTTGADGTPRFYPNGNGKVHDPSIQSIPGDDHWDDRFGPVGTDGAVYAIALSGTDVYVGGNFLIAGSQTASSIVKWNSNSRLWSAIGTGFRGAITAIAVGDSTVYVGGTFQSSAYTGFLARFSPGFTDWVQMGTWGIRGTPGATINALAVLGKKLYIGGNFGDVDSMLSSNLVGWNSITQKFFSINATGGPVRALAASGSKLYAGGDFISVDSVKANRIAVFDSTMKKWSGLGSDFTGTVNAIAVSGTDVIVAGNFSAANGVPARNIARWNGTSWSAMGSGIDTPVNSVSVLSGVVYAGGGIMHAAGVTENGIAKWDGTSWSPLGLGVGDTAAPQVNALASDGAMLYVGGSFSTAGTLTAHNIAGYDGTHWQLLARKAITELNHNGAGDAVFAVAVDGANLYVGGDFVDAGGVAASHVAVWNSGSNAWSALGSGIGGTSPIVRAIAVNGGNVFVGGIFTTAGGLPAVGIAKWNGTAWSAVGGGVGGTTPYVFAITAVGSDIYVGGAFNSAGGAGANRIAKFNGSAWSPLGAGIGDATNYSTVNAVQSNGTDIFVAGDFTIAGGAAANRIARWDGSAWKTLGTGANAPVSALAFGSSTLYAGGEFTSVGGVTAMYIARWNGTSWSALDSGFDAPVRSLALSGSDVYAGGEFTHAGSKIVNFVAHWNGSRWNGLQSDSGGIGVNGPVRSLALSGNSLFAGGAFTLAGDVRANNIALWDGAEWSSLGSDPTAGLSGVVLAVALSGKNVYVGGVFSSAGGMRANGIVRWDGANWVRMGSGLNGPVRAIAVSGTDVFAGGEFTMAGTTAVNGIARWDGAAWTSLSGGMGGPKPYVYALAATGDFVYAGGAFSTAGGATARRIAQWSKSKAAWSPLASGISGASYFTYVTALAAHGDNVYVGGVFPGADVIVCDNIAAWNSTSSAWSALGNGINGIVYAIAVTPAGEVYAGGNFSHAGTVGASNIAMWNGSKWGVLGLNILSGEVYTLAYGGNTLYLGGQFNDAGRVAFGSVAQWSGGDFHDMGNGVSFGPKYGYVTAVAADDSNMYGGGYFLTAGGRPSYYFAHWLTVAPDITSVHEQLLANVSASLYPNPASRATTISFTISRPDLLSVKVFSASGQEVARLADAYCEPGEHQIRWDCSEVPAGLYLCRLQGEYATGVLKIQVVR